MLPPSPGTAQPGKRPWPHGAIDPELPGRAPALSRMGDHTVRYTCTPEPPARHPNTPACSDPRPAVAPIGPQTAGSCPGCGRPRDAGRCHSAGHRWTLPTWNRTLGRWAHARAGLGPAVGAGRLAASARPSACQGDPWTPASETGGGLVAGALSRWQGKGPRAGEAGSLAARARRPTGPSVPPLHWAAASEPAARPGNVPPRPLSHLSPHAPPARRWVGVSGESGIR